MAVRTGLAAIGRCSIASPIEGNLVLEASRAGIGWASGMHKKIALDGRRTSPRRRTSTPGVLWQGAVHNQLVDADALAASSRCAASWRMVAGHTHVRRHVMAGSASSKDGYPFIAVKFFHKLGLLRRPLLEPSCTSFRLLPYGFVERHALSRNHTSNGQSKYSTHVPIAEELRSAG